MTTNQQDLVWKMQHGRQLVKYGIFCGNSSYFVLESLNGTTEMVDKRVVNPLVKNGTVIFAEPRRIRVSIYRLSETARRENV